VAKHKGQINYAQRLKAIRPFVDFDHDLRKPLSSAAKAQITRYYGYIQKLTVREHQVYRSSNPANLRAVQRFAQHAPTGFEHLKVAFVPNAGTERLKIGFDAKGRVRAKGSYFDQIEVELDPEDLVQADEEGFAAEYIDAQIDDAAPARQYVVMAGEFEVPSSRSRKFITEYVVDLMARYGADKLKGGEDDNHHYKNWMFGIIGYNFHDQADLAEYRRAKRQATKDRARRHVQENRKEKRINANPPGFWVHGEKKLAKLARPPQPRGWRQVKHPEYYRLVYKEGYKEIKDRTKR